MCVDQLYNFLDAAKILNIPESTLRKKAAAGLITTRGVFRHTRFSMEDLLAVQVIRPAAKTGTGRQRARGGTSAPTPRSPAHQGGTSV